MKFYPCKRKGERIFSVAVLKGGGTKSYEVVLTWELEILAIVIRGGAKYFNNDYESLDIQNRLLYKDLQYNMAVSYKIKVYNT